VTATSISLDAVIGFFFFGGVCSLFLMGKGLLTGRTMHWNSWTVDRRLEPFSFWTCIVLYGSGGTLLFGGAAFLSIPLWR
jgi:hypothetical protein